MYVWKLYLRYRRNASVGQHAAALRVNRKTSGSNGADCHRPPDDFRYRHSFGGSCNRFPSDKYSCRSISENLSNERKCNAFCRSQAINQNCVAVHLTIETDYTTSKLDLSPKPNKAVSVRE